MGNIVLFVRQINNVKLRDPKTIKIFLDLIAAAYGAGSYLAGTEMRKCGGDEGEMCMNPSRSDGTLVCLQIDEAVREYYGDSIGEEGSEKCLCIHAYNYLVGRKGKQFKFSASGTHECAWKHLHSDNIVTENEAEGPFADDTNTSNC